MNCIIVDDEPLAREAMKLLIEELQDLLNQINHYQVMKKALLRTMKLDMQLLV